MWNNCLFLLDLNKDSPRIFPVEHLALNNFRGPLFSQINSFMDNSLFNPKCSRIHGTIAQEAFSSISKIADALIIWLSSSASSHLHQEIAGNIHDSEHGNGRSSPIKHITSTRHNISRFFCSTSLDRESSSTVILKKISSFLMKHLSREAERLQSFPLLSLAGAWVPSIDSLSSTVLAASLERTDGQMHGSMDHRPCEVEHLRHASFALSDVNWTRHEVEPKTGIEFPRILNDIIDKECNSSLDSEVLVGIGSRTMKIVKIKSLKIYAFGFYVHPHSVCERLGPKYASISNTELDKRSEFYEDLLREDIDMTVRLVVNYSGMKINTVRDAFEKSLRARLVKTNPNTDYSSLKTFGSLFTHDIPLPAGTIIDFRRTSDGQLVTEIGGKKIAAVSSKELCRAFFDMYLGDGPVSEQTKVEIGRNVASILRRC